MTAQVGGWACGGGLKSSGRVPKSALRRKLPHRLGKLPRVPVKGGGKRERASASGSSAQREGGRRPACAGSLPAGPTPAS